MPGFGDTTLIVLLALLLFGPKKLPVLARQLGKLMGDFRRASNEFRTQMEEELRISEQADRQKQVAAIEANAPATPSVETELPSGSTGSAEPSIAQPVVDAQLVQELAPAPEETTPAPTPIASSGELNLMPPATGLPVGSSAFRTRTEPAANGAGEHNGSNGTAAEPAEATEARPWMI
jgi:sec-independent protein translocase protein TatB